MARFTRPAKLLKNFRPRIIISDTSGSDWKFSYIIPLQLHPRKLSDSYIMAAICALSISPSPQILDNFHQVVLFFFASLLSFLSRLEIYFLFKKTGNVDCSQLSPFKEIPHLFSLISFSKSFQCFLSDKLAEISFNTVHARFIVERRE